MRLPFFRRRKALALDAWMALRVSLAGKGPMRFSMVGRLGGAEEDRLWQEACRLTDAALGQRKSDANLTEAAVMNTALRRHTKKGKWQ